MRAQALLEELRMRGVVLRVEGECLVVEAPEEVVTEELRAMLLKNKRMIIEFLSQERCEREQADCYLSLSDPEACELKDAGWRPKKRSGKVIWASPQTGYWYGQEMALEILRLPQGSLGRSTT